MPKNWIIAWYAAWLEAKRHRWRFPVISWTSFMIRNWWVAYTSLSVYSCHRTTLLAFSFFHVIHLQWFCLLILWKLEKKTGVVVLSTPEFCYFWYYIFLKVGERHIQVAVGNIISTMFQISCWVQQWTNFWNHPHLSKLCTNVGWHVLLTYSVG